MKKYLFVLIILYIGALHCGQHPQLNQETRSSRTRDQEVIIVLSSFIQNHDYDTLGAVEVELKRHKPNNEKSIVELLSGLPLPGDNPWLTTTEEILTKLLKKARSMGANAITNLEIGSYDIYGYLHTEDRTGYQHAVYARGTAVLLHDFVGLPAPKTISKDRSYIRIQSTEYPVEKNAIILLSPFVEGTNHQIVEEIEVSINPEDKLSLTITEELLRRLMRETALRGGNAISGLDVGSVTLLKYLHQQDTVERTHTVYGKGVAIKVVPKETSK